MALYGRYKNPARDWTGFYTQTPWGYCRYYDIQDFDKALYKFVHYTTRKVGANLFFMIEYKDPDREPICIELLNPIKWKEISQDLPKDTPEDVKHESRFAHLFRDNLRTPDYNYNFPEIIRNILIPRRNF